MTSSRHTARKLVQRRKSLAGSLPAFDQIVRGSLITRYRRCGKANCHCANTKGHGPAHYLTVTFKGGKTEQILLSEAMVPVVKQYLENYERWWAALEKVSAINRKLLRMRAPELMQDPELVIRDKGSPSQE